MICSTPERSEMFGRLFTQLHRQLEYMQTFHNTLGNIEILFDDSKRFLDGGLSIGKKRQSLVQRAEGKYLCFLDSDESIPGNYLESLVRLCHKDQDICTFKAIANMEQFWSIIDMRLDYKVNDQINPNYTVRRPPWHCCPVRSVFAKMFEFPDLNNAEDFVWMEKVLTCCTSEAHTDAILFRYNHGKHSEADLIPLP